MTSGAILLDCSTRHAIRRLHASARSPVCCHRVCSRERLRRLERSKSLDSTHDRCRIRSHVRTQQLRYGDLLGSELRWAAWEWLHGQQHESRSGLGWNRVQHHCGGRSSHLWSRWKRRRVLLGGEFRGVRNRRHQQTVRAHASIGWIAFHEHYHRIVCNVRADDGWRSLLLGMEPRRPAGDWRYDKTFGADARFRQPDVQGDRHP